MEEEKEKRSVSKKIFISYGRKDAQKLAFRLEEDLKKHKHKVWLDKHDMEAGKNWTHQIEEAILDAEIFIALLSPHAVHPDGICRDEICIARYEGCNIIPVMVLKCRPPLVIYSLDWIDFQNWEISNQYNQSFERLLNTINRKNVVEGIHTRIFSELEPLDFGAEIARLTLDFTGREWLLKELDEWIEKEDSRVFFITGDPGIGKSAITARLADKHPQVVAYHFCVSSYPDSLNPNKFIKAIAAQLATQLDNYRGALEKVDLKRIIGSSDPKILMRRIVIDPLNAERLDKPVIIVVDGLDEGFVHPPPNIVTILCDQLVNLPAWVRLVLTSRKEPKILDYFSKFRPHEIEASRPENFQDVKDYLKEKLKKPKISQKLSKSGANTENVAKIISRIGAGNFLYVKEAIEAIKDGFSSRRSPSP